MDALLKIEKAVLKAFKMPLKTVLEQNCEATSVRYIIYHIAIAQGIDKAYLMKRYKRHRTNIYYGNGIAADLLSYHKEYQQKYHTIQNELKAQL